jgi:hypothetical protein
MIFFFNKIIYRVFRDVFFKREVCSVVMLLFCPRSFHPLPNMSMSIVILVILSSDSVIQ